MLQPLRGVSLSGLGRRRVYHAPVLLLALAVVMLFAFLATGGQFLVKLALVAAWALMLGSVLLTAASGLFRLAFGV